MHDHLALKHKRTAKMMKVATWNVNGIRARQAQLCEFCGSAQLVPYAQSKDSFRPESLLPFKVTEDKARDGIRAWYGRLWLAPNKLKRTALTDTVKGIYLPYWTFDAQAVCPWDAEAGHYYYTTETYTEGGQTRTREVQHVRWEPAAGRLQHDFDDDLVCASVGVHANLLRQLGEGIADLRAALVEIDRWNTTVVATYAEFGRRPRENQSGGTDHGTSSAHLALGGAVKGGLYGAPPALDRLDGNGNLPFAVDFRSYYATFLERWWGIDSSAVLGGRFAPVAVL